MQFQITFLLSSFQPISTAAATTTVDFTKNNFKFSSPEAKVPTFSQASVTQSSSNKVNLKAEIRNCRLKPESDIQSCDGMLISF